MKNELIGNWKIDPTDLIGIDNYGNISLEFFDNGDLIYSINFENKIQKIFMNYSIKENILITNQSTFLQEIKTIYKLNSDNSLMLFFDGIASKYNKLEK